MSINVNDKNLGHATAYAYYKAGGGTMTEAEFTEFMADFGTASQTAVEAARAALASETAASASATTATNKATEATTAAQTATTKAGEASTSASTATSAKDTAVSAASTATTKATEATTAAATATSAKTDAVAANTAAQSAKTAAQTAQTGAETAAASVEASAEQIATNAADISQLKSDLADMQSDGVVPSAEQILTNKGVTDSVPYHYRKTGGDGADRLYDEIVGGSLAVNQLVPDLGTLTSSGSKAFNNGTAKIAGHKYLFSANISADGNTVGLYSKADDVGTTEIILNYSAQSAIISAKKTATSDGTNNNSNGNMWLYPYIPNGSISNIMFIDLTAMFGATIADYVYGLETATAGAGVAWLKAHFPRIFNAGYIPYNAGELVSVQASAHKMTGFNQWDEEWEVGAISGDQPAIGYTNCIRSKNFCKCFPNTKYYLKCGDYTNNYYAALHWYDADKKFISVIYTAAFETTSPANARYFKMSTNTSTYLYGNVYNNDICINISSSRNGEYEPYEAHSYPLDDSLELRGIPKLDADNNLVYDGDVYESTGKVARKYGIVDLGTLNFGYNESLKWFVVKLESAKAPSSDRSIADILSDTYVASARDTIANDLSMNLVMGVTASAFLVIRNLSYTDAAIFKTAMSGVYLVYELATPTTESAQPFTNPQVVDASGTEEYVSTGIVPIGHNSFYPENLRAKVEQLPWDFASLIAPTESAFVATRNYVTGDLFIVSNVLYKATSNIANGGTITPNTNCTATTLAEIISALA